MENASKALLIAGSILIAILLIAMAVKVIDNSKGPVDSSKATMDITTAAMFNNKFIPYLGTNKSKSQAVSMMNAVIANDRYK